MDPVIAAIAGAGLGMLAAVWAMLSHRRPLCARCLRELEPVRDDTT